MSDLENVFAKVLRDKVATMPEKAELLDAVQSRGRILAVRGSYDYVEQVLPFCPAAHKQAIDPCEVPPDLDGFDVLFVGCPGDLPLDRWRGPLHQFLHGGGVLLTTDWC